MKFKVKSIIAYMIIACMLMTFMPVLAADTYESFSPVKLTIEFQGGGSSSANQKIVLPKESFPFELTANDQLNGYWLTGSATHTETGVVSNFNYVKIVDSVLRSDGDYEIHFAKVNGFDSSDSRSNIYDYDITLSMTTGATVTSFEPFKLPTTNAYQSSTKVCIRSAQLANLPFTLDANDVLNGYWLNGTATHTDGTVVEFKYVKITDSALRSDGDYEIYFNAITGFTGSGTYTYDLTLSMTSGATATSFEPFKLPTTGAYQNSSKVCIRSAQLSNLPFTFENDTLNNYFLNGTATDASGNVVEFKDVRITDSAVRTDGDYEIYFTSKSDLSASASYTYDLTLSMVGFVNLDNFESIVLPTTGAYQNSSKVCLRAAQLPNLSFNLDANDLLNGFWLNGTATDASGNVVEFKDVRITDSALRTDGDYEMYFATKSDLSASASYTYNLTLSRLASVNLSNFETVKLPTTNAYQSSNKVCLRAAQLPNITLNLDANDLLNGFYLNGTATDGTTVYTFKDVKITDSVLRSDGDYEMYFDPAAVSPTWTGSGSYTYDLTLYRNSSTTIDNFEPFKLPTTQAYYGAGATSATQKVCIRGTQLVNMPFNVDADDLLNGFYLNGTATDGTTVIEFNDVKIIDSVLRSDGDYEIHFVAIDGLSSSFNSYDLTLSRTPFVDFSDITASGNAVTLTVKNDSTKDYSSAVVVGVIYTADGADVKIVPVTLTAGASVPATITFDEAATTGKIMLWDGIGTMKPLHSVATF